MQYLRVNFGGIWRFELGFFICLFVFLLTKSGLIFKSPVAALTFDAHVNNVFSKAYARIAMLFRGFSTRNTTLLRRAYITYVRPISLSRPMHPVSGTIIC